MSIGHEQPRNNPQERGPDNDDQYRIPFDDTVEAEQLIVEQPDERTARTHEQIVDPNASAHDRGMSTAELEERLTESKGLGGAAAINFFRTRTRKAVALAATVLTLAGGVAWGVKANDNNRGAEPQPQQPVSTSASPFETTPETTTQEATPERRVPSVETATLDNFVAYFTGANGEHIEPIVGLKAAKKSLEIPVSSDFPTPETAAAHYVANVLPAIVAVNTSHESTDAYGMEQVALIDQKFKNTQGTDIVEELLEAVSTPGNSEGLEKWAKGTWNHNLSTSQSTGRHITSDIDVVRVTEHGGVTAKQVNVKFTAYDLNLVDGAKFGETKTYIMTGAWVKDINSTGEPIWKMTFSDVDLTK